MCNSSADIDELLYAEVRTELPNDQPKEKSQVGRLQSLTSLDRWLTSSIPVSWLIVQWRRAVTLKRTPRGIQPIIATYRCQAAIRDFDAARRQAAIN
jgi:hypothetical protein